MANAVTDSTFEPEVIKNSQPVLVDFWAPWCGPCLTMHPTLNRISQRYAGDVKVVRIDISKSCNQPLVQQYNIRSIPYLRCLTTAWWWNIWSERARSRRLQRPSTGCCETERLCKFFWRI
ncbi:MAG: thioredoxin family protein [Desulfovermiculus sp.]